MRGVFRKFMENAYYENLCLGFRNFWVRIALSLKNMFEMYRENFCLLIWERERTSEREIDWEEGAGIFWFNHRIPAWSRTGPCRASNPGTPLGHAYVLAGIATARLNACPQIYFMNFWSTFVYNIGLEREWKRENESKGERGHNFFGWDSLKARVENSI